MEDKLQESIRNIAGKFSEIERNKRRIQVIDPPPPKAGVRRCNPPSSKKRGRLVRVTVQIDDETEVNKLTFVPFQKKSRSKLEQLIQKAVKSGDVSKCNSIK